MPSSSHNSRSSTSSSTSTAAQPWQNKLVEACQGFDIDAPVFQIVSDRRGGRTAWSSTVTVYGQSFAARYWYDGKNLNNAKEDAAEMALNWLKSGSSGSSGSSSW